MTNIKKRVGGSILIGLFFLVLGVAVVTPGQADAATLSNTALKWTTQASAGNGGWQSITWSPQQQKLVAVASSSSFPAATAAKTMTSTDGKSWSLINMPGTRPVHSSVVWSASLNMYASVTCADSPVSVCPASTANSSVVTSPDGATWTTRTNPDATATWRSVAEAPGIGFVAVADSGTNRVMTSTNGITWTGRTAAEANAWRSVTWSPDLGLFVAVATSGTNRVMTSPDGVTWTARPAAEANTWVSVTWSPQLAKFVAVSQDGTHQAMTSPDGITWTARTTANTNAWSSVVWSPEMNMFTAVANTGTNRVMTSPDGITWTAMPAAVDNSWNAITWVPAWETFVAVSSSGTATNRVMTGSMATAGTDSATNVAARSATLHGVYSDNFPGANVSFQYRKVGGSTFTTTTPQAVVAEGAFSAAISSLDPNTAYEFKAIVQWPNANGTQTLEGGLQTFTTLLADDDNDGVFNVTEDASPNSGDANNDGTLDSTQGNVGSFVNAVTGKYAVLEVDASCQINSAAVSAESANSAADQSFEYPVGLMSFTIDCGTPGFTTTVKQYYYGAQDNYVLRKFNPNNKSYFTISSATMGVATIGGQTATTASFQITDGGSLDMDGAANGIIVDPAGLAVASTGGSLSNTGQNSLFYIALGSVLMIAGLSSVAAYKYKFAGFRQ